jgi:predicted AAA+ superfamily ATPase
LLWKDKKRRKPLLVRGARQIGKTYSIQKFADRYFSELVYVDLERHAEWHRIFAHDLTTVNFFVDGMPESVKAFAAGSL